VYDENGVLIDEMSWVAVLKGVVATSNVDNNWLSRSINSMYNSIMNKFPLSWAIAFLNEITYSLSAVNDKIGVKHFGSFYIPKSMVESEVDVEIASFDNLPATVTSNSG
jgi:hypothetical protein